MKRNYFDVVPRVRFYSENHKGEAEGQQIAFGVLRGKQLFVDGFAGLHTSHIQSRCARHGFLKYEQSKIRRLQNLEAGWHDF